MFMSSLGMLFRLFVLAEIMMVGPPDDDGGRRRDDKRRPDDGAHWPDASVTLPCCFPPPPVSEALSRCRRKSAMGLQLLKF
jgi:hypothetical protein